MSTAGRRTALLLGGSSDIGAAVTDALLRTAPGSRVVLAGRPSGRRDAVAASLGERHEVSAVDWDALTAGPPAALLDAVGEQAGAVPDLVVLAVGTLPRGGPDPTSPTGAGDLADALRVNLEAPAAVLVEAVARMAASGGGDVVVLSSVAAVRPRAEILTYALAKQALDALALSLVAPSAWRGVRVHVVRPGHVRTSMTLGLPVAPLSRTVEQVAQDVVAGLADERPVIWSPPAMRLVMGVLRRVPAALLPPSLR